MSTDLANAGWGLLLVSGVLLTGGALVAATYAPAILLGAALGGALGLAFALRFPGNPARVGYHFAKLPRQLSPYEQRLREQLLARRRPGIAVLLVSPYVVALAMWGASAAHGAPMIDLGDQAFVGFLSALQTASLAWSIQYLQILRDLKREEREFQGD